jgi:hypothetical protein
VFKTEYSTYKATGERMREKVSQEKARISVMRLLMRLWRSVFDYSEIPSDAPSGLDDRRARWAAGSMLFPFVPTFIVAVVAVALDLNPLIATAATIVVFGGCLMGAFRFAHGRPAAHFRAIRQSAKAPALAAGYSFDDTFPAPSPGMTEAVFYRWRHQLVADRMTEVVSGVLGGSGESGVSALSGASGASGAPGASGPSGASSVSDISGGLRFTAGHLEGFEMPRTQRPTLSPYSENIVMIALPGLLPELKLRATTASPCRPRRRAMQPSTPAGTCSRTTPSWRACSSPRRCASTWRSSRWCRAPWWCATAT